MEIKEQKHFDKLILDADTALYRAVKSVEEEYVLVTEISTRKVTEYKTLTKFYGHWSKKTRGKLAEINLRDGTSLTHEDFTYDQRVRLKPGIQNGEHVNVAVEHFNKFIGTLYNTDLADGIKIAIGGTKCHRHDLAHVLKYKGERKGKPLLFSEVRDAIIDEYSNSIVVCDGMEADDFLSIKGYENFLHYKKTGVWKYVLSFCDKDILMSISPSINYDKLGKGIYFQTPLEAARCFASQLLSGDKSTDNIPGLPNFTLEFQEKYGLRKSRGVGKAGALAVLEGCTTPEMFSRVAEAYRGYYGDSDKFVSWRGEKMDYSWLDHLQETAYLIWMRRTEGELIDIRAFLTKMGVNCEG